jgi:hypothetical protein
MLIERLARAHLIDEPQVSLVLNRVNQHAHGLLLYKRDH